MVNYGYNAGTKNWDESKKEELARALQKLIYEEMKITKNNVLSYGLGYNHEFPEPYVEVDGMYEGVRIRKITALSDKQSDELVSKADKIYLSIMKPKAKK